MSRWPRGPCLLVGMWFAFRASIGSTQAFEGWSALVGFVGEVAMSRGTKLWSMLKQSFTEFSEDDVMSQAAALAFYTALGLAPTVLLFLAIASFMGEGTKQGMVAQIHEMVGEEAAGAIDAVVEDADQPQWGTLSAVVAVAMMLFSASGILAQLQVAMNRVWNVEPKPGSAVWGWLRKRLLSMGMVVSIAFLLAASLVMSAAISAIAPGTGALWNLVNAAVSLLVFVLLFALIYRFLPDAKIAWSDVWVGAAITAVLFVVGKYAIGLYIGNSAVASSYGAAGSLIALLVWVYYSAVILLYGAELTQVYARTAGSGIRPDDNAQMRSRAA